MPSSWGLGRDDPPTERLRDSRARTARGQHDGQDSGQRPVLASNGLEEGEQVVHAGVEGAGAGQRGHVPGRRDTPLGVVSNREARAHVVGQTDGGASHAQGPGHARLQQSLVAGVGANAECQAQHAGIDIRVGSTSDRRPPAPETSTDSRATGRACMLAIESTPSRGGRNAGRPKRKPRRVRREVRQRDGAGCSRARDGVRRQVAEHRIRQLHLTAPDHVGQKHRGEDLRDGSDFEYGVAVEPRGSSRLARPCDTIRRPAGVTMPTTMPRLRRSVSTLVAISFWISRSLGSAACRVRCLRRRWPRMKQALREGVPARSISVVSSLPSGCESRRARRHGISAECHQSSVTNVSSAEPSSAKTCRHDLPARTCDRRISDRRDQRLAAVGFPAKTASRW